MDSIEPIQYKGFSFSFSGNGKDSPGQWDRNLLVEKQRFLAERFQVFQLQSAFVDAIELAFANGRRITDGIQFSRSPFGAPTVDAK